MKLWMALLAMIALSGLANLTHAKDPTTRPHKPAVGHFVKIDGSELSFKGGFKGTGKVHVVKIDDKTKVTLDDNDIKASDLKEGVYIEVTVQDGVATAIKALTNPPAPKPHEKKAPATQPASDTK